MKNEAVTTAEVEKALAAEGILTMASGEMPNELKFFLYAQDSVTKVLFLIQATISKGEGDRVLTVLVKTDSVVADAVVDGLIGRMRASLQC